MILSIQKLNDDELDEDSDFDYYMEIKTIIEEMT